MHKLARVSLTGAWCLLVVAGAAEAALDQVIGLSTDDHGSALVKRFRVPAGTVVTGIEVKSNDDRTVFPKIELFRGPASRLCDAARLAEASNLPSTERHRVRRSLDPIVAIRAEEIFVAVGWPVSAGVRGIGDGAGIGATALTTPGDCFISPGHGEPLQPLLADLAISLLTESRAKASTGEPNPVTEPVVETFLGNPVPQTGGATRIEFGLAKPGPIRLEIYDVAGRRVRTLVQGDLAAGRHMREWDSCDDHGRAVAAGMYFAKLDADAKAITQKTLVTR